ncbi:hypothetical protein CI102_6369 [Trichoderma harzianum]|nr:hypothetical protein CI102_6369 [Trichoderma harzianum]
MQPPPPPKITKPATSEHLATIHAPPTLSIGRHLSSHYLNEKLHALHAVPFRHTASPCVTRENAGRSIKRRPTCRLQGDIGEL